MKFPFSKLRVSRTFSLDIVKARGIENLRGFCDSLGCGVNIQRSQETGAHFCSTINPAGPYNTKNKHTNSNKNKITLDRAPDWLGPGSSSQSNCRIGWAPACRVDVRLEISSLLLQKQDVQTTLGLLLKQIIPSGTDQCDPGLCVQCFGLHFWKLHYKSTKETSTSDFSQCFWGLQYFSEITRFPYVSPVRSENWHPKTTGFVL